MNAVAEYPDFRVSRKFSQSDKVITISLRDSDLDDKSIFTVIAAGNSTPDQLIEHTANFYGGFKKCLVVDSYKEAEEYFDICLLHAVSISIRENSEIVPLRNSVDRSLATLKIKGVCSKSIHRAAQQLVGNVGLRFTREDAIKALHDTNELISICVATEAVDLALSSLFKRVKESKSVSVKTVSVKSAEEAYELAKKQEKGVCLFKLPTAKGKTEKILYQAYLDNIGSKTVYIAHRRSIVRSVMPGMNHYKDDVKPFAETNIGDLKVVVNSLINPSIKQITSDTDLLLIDEAQQTLRHIITGRLDNESKRGKIFNELLRLIKTTDKVLMADADINDVLIKYIKLVCKKNITVYQIETDHSDIQINVNEFDVVKSQFYDAVAGGGKCLLAMDNASLADGIYERLVLKHPEKKMLLLTQENIENKAQQAFLSDPNNHDYEVIIYSPIITSSVSIVKAHFTAYFGLFEGILLPQDCIQMLRRSRLAKLFTIGLKNPRNRDYSAENRKGYLKEFEGKCDFDRIAAMLDADDKYIRSHFVAAMLANLKVDKFNIVVDSSDEVKLVEGIKSKKEEKQLSCEKYLSGVANALNLDVDKDFKLEDEESTSSNYYMAEAKRLKAFYKSDNITKSDILLFEKGALIGALKNLFIPSITSQSLDRLKDNDQLRFTRYKEYPEIRLELFELMFKTLGLNFETGEGVYTELEANRLLKLLYKRRSDFNKISEIKAAAAWKNGSGYSVRVVNQLLNQFFRIEVNSKVARFDSKRIRKYSLCEKKFAILKNLLNNIYVS